MDDENDALIEELDRRSANGTVAHHVQSDVPVEHNNQTLNGFERTCDVLNALKEFKGALTQLSYANEEATYYDGTILHDLDGISDDIPF